MGYEVTLHIIKKHNGYLDIEETVYGGAEIMSIDLCKIGAASHLWDALKETKKNLIKKIWYFCK